MVRAGEKLSAWHQLCPKESLCTKNCFIALAHYTNCVRAQYYGFCEPDQCNMGEKFSSLKCQWKYATLVIMISLFENNSSKRTNLIGAKALPF